MTQLQDELNSAQIMKTLNYTCDDCEFSSDTEQKLKTCMKSVHETLCQYCDSAFARTRKLKNHVCRNNVKNPPNGTK